MEMRRSVMARPNLSVRRPVAARELEITADAMGYYCIRCSPRTPASGGFCIGYTRAMGMNRMLPGVEAAVAEQAPVGAQANEPKRDIPHTEMGAANRIHLRAPGASERFPVHRLHSHSRSRTGGNGCGERNRSIQLSSGAEGTSIASHPARPFRQTEPSASAQQRGQRFLNTGQKRNKEQNGRISCSDIRSWALIRRDESTIPRRDEGHKGAQGRHMPS